MQKTKSSDILKLRVAELRRRTKNRAIEYKGGKCLMCGYDKCVAALEFHHRNPDEKELRLSSGNTMTWSRVEPELDKCDLLCSNCHREIHHAWREASVIEARARIEAMRRQPPVDVSCWQCQLKFSVNPSRAARNSTIFCSKACARVYNQKIDWPSDEELTKMVWSDTAYGTARKLGVSDNAVLRRLKRRGLKTPPRGYWAKLRAEKSI